MTKTLQIEGMNCAHCVAAVTKALQQLEGVERAAVELEAKTATVELAEGVTDAALRDAVDEAGFEVTAIA